MFLPTYDTHECTVDKLDLVLKNLEKILSRKSMIAQVAESWLALCVKMVSCLPISHQISLRLTLSQMVPSEAAAEPAQWLAAVEAVPPWRMA